MSRLSHTRGLYSGYRLTDYPLEARAEGTSIKDRDRYLDAILISLYLGDHLSPETLRTYPHDIPIIAAPNTVKSVKQLKLFDLVLPLDILPAREQAREADDVFPSWLCAQYMVSPKSYLEVAIVLTIDRDPGAYPNLAKDTITSDTLVYVLHRVPTELLDHLVEDESTHILGLFHSHLSSHVPWETFQTGSECLQVVRQLKPDWRMPNHGDPYTLTGLYKYLLSLVILPLKDVFKLEAGPEGKEKDLERTRYEDVPPGGVLALV